MSIVSGIRGGLRSGLRSGINPSGVTPGALVLDRTLEQYATNSNMHLPAEWSVQVWVYMPSLPVVGESHVIASEWLDPSDRSFQFLLDVHGANHAVYLGVSSDGVGLQHKMRWYWVPVAETWYHICVSYGAVETKCYIDAVDQGVRDWGLGTPVAPHAGSAAFLAGARATPTSMHHFRGRLDDLRIWSKAISDAENAANYNGEIDPATAGLSSYYKFNGDLQDCAADGEHLTAINGASLAGDLLPF